MGLGPPFTTLYTGKCLLCCKQAIPTNSYLLCDISQYALPCQLQTGMGLGLGKIRCVYWHIITDSWHAVHWQPGLFCVQFCSENKQHSFSATSSISKCQWGMLSNVDSFMSFPVIVSSEAVRKATFKVVKRICGRQLLMPHQLRMLKWSVNHWSFKTSVSLLGF